MKRLSSRIWLWAYLGPVFLLMATLLCLTLHRYETLSLLFLGVCALPAAALWGVPALMGSALLMGGALFLPGFDPALRLWYLGFASLLLGSATLTLLTLRKLSQPLEGAAAEGKKGWERAEVLEGHLKELHKGHLEEMAEMREERAHLEALQTEQREALNDLRYEVYQGSLDVERLRAKRRIALKDPAIQTLKGQLKQLRSQFQLKDEELFQARRERYEWETRLLELERRFEEAKRTDEEEIFWVTPPDTVPEEGNLEELVGELLGELQSRCVPALNLDLSVLQRKT